MSEIQIQSECFQWAWNHPSGKLKHKIFSINNNSKGSIINAVQMKASGLVPGIPDLCALLDDRKVFWFEIKTDKGTISESQKKIHMQWEQIGHVVFIIRSVDQFKNICNEYIFKT